jgi:hypothetical protein
LQQLGGRAGHKAAVEGDLAWSKAKAVQLPHGLVEQAVLARVAGCGRRRQHIAAGTATGVGGNLGQLGDIAELVGRAAVAESWFASLKVELVHRQHYRTRAEARTAIFRWIAWYNSFRLHSASNYLPPIEWEHQHTTISPPPPTMAV